MGARTVYLQIRRQAIPSGGINAPHFAKKISKIHRQTEERFA